jgi:hypothetical protein
MRIDSGGRVGLGGTLPNTNMHTATFPATIAAGDQGVIFGNADSLQIGANYYWNGSAFKYLGTGKASRNYHSAGNVVFETTDSSGSVDGALTFTERMRILAAGGLTFNGDTAAANALDDYEEGSWTPVLTGMSVTSGTLDGSYRKIGGVVTATMRLDNATLTGTHSGARIEGLPYNCGLRTSGGKPVSYNHQYGDKTLGLLIEGGTSLVYLQYHGTGAWSEAAFSAGANRYFAVQLTYNTSS